MNVQETLKTILATCDRKKYYQVYVKNYNPETGEASGVYVMEDKIVTKAKMKRQLKKLDFNGVIYNE